MKTRTLLLLSVGCGMAILVAGLVMLWRTASQEPAPKPSAVGERVVAGPWALVVDGARRTAAGVEVTVQVGASGGTARPLPAQGFRLFAAGNAYPGSLAPGCRVETTPSPCAVTFAAPAAAGSATLLFVSEAARASWSLPMVAGTTP